MKFKSLLIIVIIFIITSFTFGVDIPKWIGVYKLYITEEWVIENFPDSTEEELNEIYEEFSARAEETQLELKKDYTFKVELPDGIIEGNIEDKGIDEDGYKKLILKPTNLEEGENEPVTALYKEDIIYILEEDFNLPFKKQTD